MKAIFKEGMLILVPQQEDSQEEIDAWKVSMTGHVALLKTDTGTGLAFQDLGMRSVACNEPINVTSQPPDERVRLIGNFANTPFELDGRRFVSVESFWQGLKFDDGQREEFAAMSGAEARGRGNKQGYGATIQYDGREIVVGTWGHWELMQRACTAKFTQHHKAQSALLETFPRPLIHRVRRDSRTIPGAVMAEIWMKIRKNSLKDQEVAYH